MNKEVYLTWKFTPVTEADGSVSGAFASVRDTTDAVLYERRMQALKELYDATGSADILDVFYTQSVSALRRSCAEDLALFGLYVLDANSTKVLTYRCGFGLRNNPDRITFDPDPALFEQAILDSSMSAVYITAMASGFRNYIEYDPARGWSDEITELVFLPVMRDNNSVVGVAVIGLNPRRPFDEPYELFLELLGRQLATGIDNLRHLEEASDKLSWEVALSMRKREELEQMLQEKTKQLRISEGRFSRMAKILPAGLFLASPEGEIIYANEAWYTLSSYPRNGNPSFWIKAVHPGDRVLVRDSWRRAKLGKSERIEFRWAVRPGEVSKFERWCASAISAEFDSETGKISTLTGIWTDITERKQSEALQRQRADDAVERKRQQEYFIDAISHEMRNPLSAIMQCVDVATQKMTFLENIIKKTADVVRGLISDGDVAQANEAVDEATEALEMMHLCSSHMNRIITDTIDLSKIESGLFPVNPVACRPVSVVNEVLHMYEHELKKCQIYYSVEIGERFKEIGVDVVKMDPLRVRQVLINLIMNAIKVLGSSDCKQLTVKLDASESKPTFQSHNNASFYLPSHASRKSTTSFSKITSGASPAKKSVLLSSSMSSPSLSSFTTSTDLTSGSADIFTKGTPELAVSYASLAASLSTSPSAVPLSSAAEESHISSSGTLYLIFSVKDTGSGMDPEQLDTAFHRFTSHFTPRTHVHYGGTGLGLYVSRKLVENQGGEITAETKKNEGSEFVFYIKVRLPRDHSTGGDTTEDDEDGNRNEKAVASRRSVSALETSVSSSNRSSLDVSGLSIRPIAVLEQPETEIPVKRKILIVEVCLFFYIYMFVYKASRY